MYFLGLLVARLFKQGLKLEEFNCMRFRVFTLTACDEGLRVRCRIQSFGLKNSNVPGRLDGVPFSSLFWREVELYNLSSLFPVSGSSGC